MTLGTFGAIMGFASKMVGCSLDIYKTAIEKAIDPVLKETLKILLEDERKNYFLVEQMRRENVTEMILEPIAGLHEEDYEIGMKVFEQARDVDLLKMALLIEEEERRFFNDSSGKVPFPEVSRIFRKIAQKKEKNLIELRILGLD